MKLSHLDWQGKYKNKNEYPMWQRHQESTWNISVLLKCKMNLPLRDNKHKIDIFQAKKMLSLYQSAPSGGEQKASSHHNYGMSISFKMHETVLNSDIFHGNTIVTTSQNAENISGTDILPHVCPACTVARTPLTWNSCHIVCTGTMHHLGDAWCVPWVPLSSLVPHHICHIQTFYFDVQ